MLIDKYTHFAPAFQLIHFVNVRYFVTTVCVVNIITSIS